MSSIIPQNSNPRQLSFLPDDHQSSPFDQIRHVDEHGYEYWVARELMPLLDYTDWRNFRKAITKAKTTCKNSGNSVENHFGVLASTTQSGKGRKQEIEDFKLSRYACYLVADNADPEKTPVAEAKTYFVSQARRAEVAQQRFQQKRQLKRQQDIVAYQNQGKPEDWAIARVDSKESQKALNAALYQTHEDHSPDYGAIAQIQNVELLGMVKSRIVDYLGLLPKDAEKYRDHLGRYAQEAIKETNYISKRRMKILNRPLTDQEQQEIVIEVVRRVGPTMRDLATFAGEDFLSGADLDDQGTPLIMRNIRLLNDGR